MARIITMTGSHSASPVTYTAEPYRVVRLVGACTVETLGARPRDDKRRKRVTSVTREPNAVRGGITLTIGETRSAILSLVGTGDYTAEDAAALLTRYPLTGEPADSSPVTVAAAQRFADAVAATERFAFTPSADELG